MNLQQVEKIINFFRLTHDFHDPYLLLLDGNFMALLLQHGIDIARRVSLLTKGHARLKVTHCTLRELELLGSDFRLVLEQARLCQVINCGHPLEHTADKCILSQVGSSNAHSYIVCSQDLQLRRALREVERVPIMYVGPDQRVTMEDIFKHTMAQVKKGVHDKLMPRGRERQQVEEHKKEQAQKEKEDRIRKLESEFGFKVKTKIAKGPNPLAVRKKKIRDEPQEEAGHEKEEEEVKPKRKRIRKRNRGRKNPQNLADQQRVVEA